jgi:hypothetical protein
MESKPIISPQTRPTKFNNSATIMSRALFELAAMHLAQYLHKQQIPGSHLLKCTAYVIPVLGAQSRQSRDKNNEAYYEQWRVLSL